MSSKVTDNAQRDWIRRMREESRIGDRRDRLELVAPFRIEHGPSPEAYYKLKHASGKYGSYFFHQMARG